MRHVPEPDRAEWVARMRERARRDADELLPRPPFVVFGLAEPRLRSGFLAEAGQVNGAWESIGLAYGHWAEPAGPWVVVTTRTGRADLPDREIEADLLRAIDHDRNRIASQAGVDENGPDVPPDYWRAALAVGGRSVSGLAGRPFRSSLRMKAPVVARDRIKDGVTSLRQSSFAQEVIRLSAEPVTFRPAHPVGLDY